MITLPRRVLWLSVPFLAALGAFGLLSWLLAPSVSAQGSPYVWYCQMENGAAPVCSFGDYTEVHAEAASSSTAWVYDPDDGATFRYSVIVPPTSTVRMTATCSAFIYAVEMHSGPCNTCLAAGSYQIGENDTWINVNVEPTSLNQASTVTTDTWEIVWWTPDPGGHPLPSALPAVWTDADDYPFLRVRAASRGGMDDMVFTEAAAACVVDAYQLYDGSVHVPPVYVPPTPVPDPTATAGWVNKPFVPITWVTAAPQLGDFTFTPGDETCYTLIPEPPEWLTSFTVLGLYSVTIPSWDDQGVCAVEWDLQSEFFTYDFDGYVYSFMSILLVMWMVRHWTSA